MATDISTLYIKDMYLNKNISYITNKVIVEYDLKSANTSLCREYRLLDDDIIDKIENNPKKKRVVIIGKIQRNNVAFKNAFKESFIDIRKRFFEANNIKDEDILSIKKDAIFCLKECIVTDFGKCHFIKKNFYTSYMYLNNLEIYYNSRGKVIGSPIIDVKGIDDEVLEYHNDYMIKFLKILFNHMETSSKSTTLEFYKRFVDRYKHLKLEVGYYREFNNMSIIRLIDSDETYIDDVFIPYQHKQEHISIDYNFINIIIPIAKFLL